MRCKENKIKVLHIGADNIGYGGRSVIAYNLTQYMDEGAVQNDFLIFKQLAEIFLQRIKCKGGNVILIELTNSLPKLRYEKERARKIISAAKIQNYDIVHIHADHAYEALKSIWIAKKAGIRAFVIHAHNTGSEEKFSKLKKMFVEICKLMITLYRPIKFACSQEAADYLFGKRFSLGTQIIKNGIAVDRFKFNSSDRILVRNNFNYNQEQLIIGCIGRFTPQKNHIFLMDIFEEVLKINLNTRLMLIGEGNLKSKIEEIACKKNILKSIDFLGNRNDVPQLLSAIDIFVLPSLYEGFGIVNLEAQCTGLPCIVSKQIPKTVQVTDLLEFISLEESPKYWACKILSSASSIKRIGRADELLEQGFDIKSSACYLQERYQDIIRRMEEKHEVKNN